MYFLKMMLHFFGKDVVLATKHLQQLPPRLSLQTANTKLGKERVFKQKAEAVERGIKQMEMKTKSEGRPCQMLRAVKAQNLFLPLRSLEQNWALKIPENGKTNRILKFPAIVPC